MVIYVLAWELATASGVSIGSIGIQLFIEMQWESANIILSHVSASG